MRNTRCCETNGNDCFEDSGHNGKCRDQEGEVLDDVCQVNEPDYPISPIRIGRMSHRTESLFRAATLVVTVNPDGTTQLIRDLESRTPNTPAPTRLFFMVVNGNLVATSEKA